MRNTLLLMLALTLTLCVSDAGVVAGPSTPERAEVMLRVLRGDKSETLDPHATNSGGDAQVIFMIYECLTRPSDTTPIEWQPGLAESWEVDDTCSTWTFKLRRGVSFHDGSKLDAEAVVLSFNRARGTDKTAAPRSLPYADEYLSCIDGISNPDELTVMFKLNEPHARFLSVVGLFATAIISPKAIDHMKTIRSSDERTAWLTRHSAGTGPYRVVEPEDFDSKSIEMTAFKKYWGGSPSVDQLVVETETSSKTRNEMLLAGKVDFLAEIAPSDRKALDKDEGVALSVRPGENICYLAMNCSEKAARPTAQFELRKAIALAARRPAYVELYEDACEPLFGLLPPTVPGYLADFKPSGDELGDDEAVKKAKALLEEAGLPEEPLKLIIPSVPRPYLSRPAETADLIKQQLAAAGLEVKIQAIPMREIVDVALREDYDLLLLGWMGETGQADDFYAPLLGGHDGKPMDANFARFWNEELVKKIDTARLEASPDIRRETFEQLEKTVFDKHRPLVPLYTTTMAEAWRAEWTGIRVDAVGGWHFEGAVKP